MSPSEARRRAWTLRKQGRFSDALTLISPLAAAAREGDDLVLAIELTDEEANLLGYVGERGAALTRATWSVSVAADPANDAALASERATRCIARAYRTWASAAMESEQVRPASLWPMLDAFEATLRRRGRARWLWNVDTLRGNLHRKLGQHAEAVPCLTRAIEGALSAPSSPGVTLGSLRRSLAWSLRRLGRHDEAIAQLERVIQDPEVDLFDLVTARIYLAQTLVHAERFQEAAVASDHAVEGAEALAQPQQLAAWGTAVEAWLGAGRLDDAAHASTRVLEMAKESGRSDDLFGANQDAFDVAMARGERAQAAANLAEMQRLLIRIERQGVDPYRRDVVAARQARLAEGRHDPR